jgi:pimeloyl-ACP methyl ester carboxylesterase
MQETTIEAGGEKIRVLEAGRGETVLFLHGAGGLNWYPLLDLLSASRRVLAPEHPGFGHSDLPSWLSSVGDLAFFYLDLLAQLDLKDVHLVGHSLGGWTAAEIAIRDTRRVKSLSLLAPAGVQAVAESYGDIFLWPPEEHARNSFYDQSLAEERIRGLAAADIDVMLQNRAAAARLAWSPRLHNPQLAHWLHRIDVPTLLVWGEDDRICPFACRSTFLDQIKGAQLRALAQTGHALHSERHAEVAAHLQEFFAHIKG